MDLTLLEVHLDGASFTANAPLSGESESAVEASGDDDAGPPLLPFVVGVVALAGLAYLVRRWRAGGAKPADLEAEMPEVDAPTP
jgi:MYXO-CTERM domain-containing protein